MIDGWSLLVFLGAADCELLYSSSLEEANHWNTGDCSRDDPPRMGNVSSIETNPRHSPCVVFPGNDFLHHCYFHLQHPEEFTWYVGAD